jgi:hypothetical protein
MARRRYRIEHHADGWYVYTPNETFGPMSKDEAIQMLFQKKKAAGLRIHNPLSSNTKLAIGIAGAAAVVGGIALATRKPLAAAPPAPAPTPPSPVPVPPVPIPTPAPSGNPVIAGILQNGKSYTFGLSAVDTSTVGTSLLAAGISGAQMTCLSGGICTGTFVWQGVDGTPLPQIPGITWISVMPTLTGLGQYGRGGGVVEPIGPTPQRWPAPAPAPPPIGPRCPPGQVVDPNTHMCTTPVPGGGEQYGGSAGGQVIPQSHHGSLHGIDYVGDFQPYGGPVAAGIPMVQVAGVEPWQGWMKDHGLERGLSSMFPTSNGRRR